MACDTLTELLTRLHHLGLPVFWIMPNEVWFPPPLPSTPNSYMLTCLCSDRQSSGAGDITARGVVAANAGQHARDTRRLSNISDCKFRNTEPSFYHRQSP